MYKYNLQHYIVALKNNLLFISLLLMCLTASAGDLPIKPINTLDRINSPVAIPKSPAMAPRLKRKALATPRSPFVLKTIVVLSVGFAPGNYTTPDASGLQSLVTTLEQGPEIVDIRIEGHSYNQELHASERLALMRACIVRQALIAAGIERAIKTTGVFANNIAETAPFTGVRAYLTYPHNTTR